LLKNRKLKKIFSYVSYLDRIGNSFLATDVHRKSLSAWRYAHSVFFVSAVICGYLRPIKFNSNLEGSTTRKKGGWEYEKNILSSAKPPFSANS